MNLEHVFGFFFFFFSFYLVIFERWNTCASFQKQKSNYTVLSM